MLFFNRRTSTGNGLFTNLCSGFAQCFRSIVSIRIKQLSNTNWVVSRHIERREASFSVELYENDYDDEFFSILSGAHVNQRHFGGKV